MSPKQQVLKKFPAAQAQRDIDGFWWVRIAGELRALNDPRREVRSAAAAWKSAATRALYTSTGHA